MKTPKLPNHPLYPNIGVIYQQDVWQIRLDALLCDKRRRTRSSYAPKYPEITQARFCELGYLVGDVFCGVLNASVFSEESTRKIATRYLRYLSRFQTQADLSRKMLKYLQNPNRGLHNIRLHLIGGELLYQRVPVPIYRPDFPNKAIILMTLEAKIAALEPSRYTRIWRPWKNIFDKLSREFRQQESGRTANKLVERIE